MKCSVILTVDWPIYLTCNSSVITVIICMRDSSREFW